MDHEDDFELGRRLTGQQKSYLRGLAHALRPMVQVGQSGVTDAVITAVNRALLDHELIKVRLFRPEQKKVMATELVQRTQAYLCGLIGHTVILYRPHPETPKIKLPQRTAEESSGN